MLNARMPATPQGHAAKALALFPSSLCILNTSQNKYRYIYAKRPYARDASRTCG